MKKRIVVIGGGTGTHTVLRGIKHYHRECDIAAIVTMADSGGSTGRLRDEFGQLPVGDARMALAALAREDGQSEELLRQLFMYRFAKGAGLEGHNFGNLFLVALTELLGSEAAAIAAAGSVLRVVGQVHPVTESPVDLIATYDDGVTIVGEHDIDEPPTDRYDRRIVDLEVTPSVPLTAAAAAAIKDADLIVLGPGDLYTSLLANVVVPGVAAELQATDASFVYVANLMTKAGQTTGYGLRQHVETITHYVGRAPDHILANTTPLPPDLLGRYAAEHEYPVDLDLAGDKRLIVADLLADEEITTTAGDVLKRSLIRHDSTKLAQHLRELL